MEQTLSRIPLMAALVFILNAISGSAMGGEALASGGTANCSDLAAADFSGVPDAPTQIIAADAQGDGDVPAYCRVQGYVTPNVGFELRLPATNWNGKFFQAGCGGWCGSALAGYNSRACDDPLRRGYACLQSDQGHKSTIIDGKWAYNNVQAEIDWSYRSIHVSSIAGKAIAEHFYSQAPKRSYLMGCSGGGRVGLIEAQRFPWDFDGIAVGAPGSNLSGAAMFGLWMNLSLRDKEGKFLLSADDIRRLHDAVLAKCDMDDGVRDGLVGNPAACTFSPSELSCKGSGQSGCLTPVQVEAIRKIYNGPANSKGEALYTGGQVPGSELTWISEYMTYVGPYVTDDYFRYMAFVPDAGPTWQRTAFDWDRDYKRFGMTDQIYTAENPDMRKFKAAGGKLIGYQGWTDASGAAPRNWIDIYETAERTMGGRAATQDFCACSWFREWIIAPAVKVRTPSTTFITWKTGSSGARRPI